MGDDKGAKLQPTIIVPPVKPVARPKAAPAPKVAPISVKSPTRISGEDRKRIVVTEDALKRLSPGAPRGVVDHAARLVSRFNAETASERRAVMWGIDVQKSYADAVNAGLDLAQSPGFAKVEGHVARTLAILQSIDLKQVFSLGERPGGLSRIFGSARDKIDTQAELDEARRELDQLSKLMGASLKELLGLKEKLAKNAKSIHAIGAEADAYALAALFLSEHLQKDKPLLADKFASRSISLGQTYAQIRAHGSVNDLHVARPEQLVALMQHVALVSLPDFIASLSSLLALQSRRSRVSETEARDVEHKLRAIIQEINT